MRKILLIFLAIASISITAWSQTKVFVGDTTGSSAYNYGPIYRSSSGSSYNYSTYGLLYEASDLLIPSGSMINKIAFKKANAFTLTDGVCDVTIRMKNSVNTGYTSAVTYGTMTSAPYTVVYASLTDSFTSGADTWHEWTLTTPFAYTGGSLEVSIDFFRDGATSNGALTWYYETATGKSVGIANSAGFTAIAQSSSSYSNKMLATRFDVAFPAGACLPPSGLTTTNVTSTSVDVSWNSGGASNAYLEYGPTGFTLGSGTNMYVSATTASLSSLLSNTTYDVYVKDSCANNASLFIGPSTFTTLCASQATGTVTIDPSMPASATNYQSFTDFVNDVNVCGIGGAVTVNVKEGTYNEQFSLGAIPGLSSTNTITIQSNPANTMPVIVVDSATVSADNYVINFNGSSWITIDGLTLTGKGASYSRVINFEGNNEHITIQNCILSSAQAGATSTNHAVIFDNTSTANKSNHISILNNEINNGSYGIYLYGVGSSDFENGHVVSGNTVKDFYYYGIRVYYADSAVISNNTLTSLPSGSSYTTVYGIYNGYSDHSTITGNTLVLSSSATIYGLYNYYCDGTVAKPNLIANNMISCFDNTGNTFALSLYANYYTNVYYNSVNVTHGSATGGRALYLYSGSTGSYGFVDLKNNIAVNTGGGYAVEISSGAATLGYVSSSDNNILYATGPSLATIGTTDFADLAAFQAVTLTDVNSLSGDPSFYLSDNLHLAGLIADNAGTPVSGVTTDIDGQTRSMTTPDIGADEYTAPSCLPPGLLTAANVVGFSADLGWTAGATETMWDVEYGTVGFTQGAGTLVTNTTANPYTATGLIPETDYEFYVRAKCSSSSSPWIGPIAFTTTPACPMSTALSVANLTTTSADLTWTSLNGLANVEYGPAGFAVGAGTMLTGVTSPQSITGLTPATAYDFYVVEDCSASSNGYSDTAKSTFTSALQAAVGVACTSPGGNSSVIFTEDFENNNAGWTGDVGSGNGNWEIPDGATSTSTGASDGYLGGSYMNYESSSTSTNQGSIVSPAIDLTTASDDVELSFWMHAYGASMGTLNVGVGTSATGTFTTIFSWSGQLQTSENDPWVNIGVNLASYVGQTIYLQFTQIDDKNNLGSGFDGDMSIDFVEVSTCVNCSQPTALGVTALTSTSADIYFTGGGAPDYNIEYGISGFAQGAGTMLNATNDTVSITGLTANTDYDVYVRDSCGLGLTSAWSGPFSFYTGYCTPAPSSVDGTGITNVSIGTINNTTGAEAGNYGDYSAMQTDVSQGATITVDITYSTNYTYGTKIWVDWNDNFVFDEPSELVYTGLSGSASPTTLSATFTVPVTAPLGNHRMRIGGTDNDSGPSDACYTGTYGSFEDYTLNVLLLPTCPAPSALGATNITATSADVYWTTGGASSWLIEYDATGFTPGTGNSMVATNDTTTISGLVGNTVYDFYVRDYCGVGDTSAWSGPYSFNTLCLSFTAPFVEDAETATGNANCWSQEFVTGSSAWSLGTGSTGGAITTANSGSLNFVHTSSLSGGVTRLISPVIDASGLSSTVLSFSYGQEEWFGDQNTLAVYYRDAISSSWNMVFEDTTNVVAWKDTSFTIPTSSATLQIAFEATDNFGRAVVVDDVSIAAPPAGLSPFALLSPANNAVVVVGGTPTAQIEIAWQESAPTATYEWRAFNAPATLNNPMVALPSNNGGTDTVLTLTMAQADALLASLNVNVGDTVPVSWNVKASMGNDSVFGTQTFIVNLVRGNLASPNYVVAPQGSNANTGLSGPDGVNTYHRSSTIVFPGEFAAANVNANSMLRSFGFSLYTPASGAVEGILKVYLVNTTDATYSKGNVWSSITPGMTEVFNDTVNIASGASEYIVQLTQNFAYLGSAVYVAYDWEMLSTPLTTGLSYNANNLVTSSINRASSSVAPPATLSSASSFRPTFFWGVDKLANDYEVVTIWSKGKNPLNYGAPEEIQVVVKNNGFVEDTKMVTLTVSGANTFTASLPVNLAVGQDTVLNFSFNATTAGFNTITASVPADDNLANDSKSWYQESTTDTYGYGDTAVTNLGGLGYSTASGLLVSKFDIAGTGSVTDVNLRFSSDAASTGNVVFAVLLDNTGAVVGQSANYTILASDLDTWKTFSIPMPPTFTNEEIYVGIGQTANTAVGYFPLAYQEETPTRADAYFTAGLTGTGLAALQGGYRFMIEAVIAAPALCQDPATLAATPGCDEADVTWTSAVGATSTIEYGPVGFTPGSGMMMQNVTSPATITGLALGTAYDFYVMDTCANGSASTLVGPVTFTTDTMPNISINATLVSAGTLVNYDFDVTSGAASATTITWDFGDGNSGTGANANHDYTANGTYTVVCVATNACGSDTATTTALVQGIGLDENSIANVELFPNPNNGFFTLTGLTNFGDKATVEVISVTGVVIYKTEIIASSSKSFDIDLKGSPAGMYQVRISSDKGFAVRQFVLNK